MQIRARGETWKWGPRVCFVGDGDEERRFGRQSLSWLVPNWKDNGLGGGRISILLSGSHAASSGRSGGKLLVPGSGENSDFPARNWTKPPVKLQPTLHPDPRSRSQQHLRRSDDDNTDDTFRQRRSHLDLHPPYAATPSDRTLRLKQATPCATPVGARSYKRTGDVPKEVPGRFAMRAVLPRRRTSPLSTTPSETFTRHLHSR